MDFLFNCIFVPRSTAGKTLIIRPSGKTFITSFAKSYSTEYSKETLGDKMTEIELQTLIDSYNTTISTFWPCMLCILFGYLLAPLTCCLSFYCPF